MNYEDIKSAIQDLFKKPLFAGMIILILFVLFIAGNYFSGYFGEKGKRAALSSVDKEADNIIKDTSSRTKLKVFDTNQSTMHPKSEHKIVILNVEITDLYLVVRYSKNFNTCAHLIGIDNKIVHNENLFCEYGENIYKKISLSKFHGVINGSLLKLCHGNNRNICSDYIQVSLPS